MAEYRGRVQVLGGCTVLYCTVLYCTVLYCTAGAGGGDLAAPRLLPPQDHLPALVHGAPPHQRGGHSLLSCQTIEYCLVDTRHIVMQSKYIQIELIVFI